MKKILKQNITTIKKGTDFANYNEVKERLLFSAIIHRVKYLTY